MQCPTTTKNMPIPLAISNVNERLIIVLLSFFYRFFIDSSTVLLRVFLNKKGRISIIQASFIAFGVHTFLYHL